MGYISDVAIIAHDSDKNMRVHLTAFRVSYPEEWKHIAKDDCTNWDDETFFFEDSCKWYEEFPGVQAFMKLKDWLIDRADDLDMRSLAVAYVRVGEEEGDYDAEYGGDGGWTLADVRMHVETNISAPDSKAYMTGE